jgi:hypothetical protein
LEPNLQHHVEAKVLPDPSASICVADYAYDVHPVEIVITANSSRPIVEGCIGGPAGAFEIPYSAITPRASEMGNLLVPVALSASHVAFAPIRLELTWMALGQSAGVAAALVAASNITVHALPCKVLHQALLKAGQILHV